MSFLVYGSRLCGRVDRVEGLFHVVTRFGHLWHLPILPLGSRLVVTGEAGPTSERRLPLQGRSILTTYLRSYGGLAATLAGAASTFFLADAVLLSTHLLLPLALWALSLVLMQLAVRLPMRFAVAPAFLWLALTVFLVVMGQRQSGVILAQPRCWITVGVCVGLIWIADLRWRYATPERALELAAKAGVPAEWVLDRMPIAPGAAAAADAAEREEVKVGS
jgi:hypothetical protein